MSLISPNSSTSCGNAKNAKCWRFKRQAFFRHGGAQSTDHLWAQAETVNGEVSCLPAVENCVRTKSVVMETVCAFLVSQVYNSLSSCGGRTYAKIVLTGASAGRAPAIDLFFESLVLENHCRNNCTMLSEMELKWIHENEKYDKKS